MNDAMSAEFDTVAEWTADAALDLGPQFHLPAACRGSGSPGALEFMLDRMDLVAGAELLDCGAGVGGPAAYAVQRHAVQPILVEPEAGACRAARRLFGYPVVQASGDALPLRDGTFAAAWALGVLCTTPDPLALLAELRRVVRPDGHIALLVFVERAKGGERPEGNDFPTEPVLAEMIDDAALRVVEWQGTSELPAIPQDWQRREEAVTAHIGEAHGHEESWRLAEHQSHLIGELLSNGTITGELIVLRRR